jgi:hypothetical protein
MKTRSTIIAGAIITVFIILTIIVTATSSKSTNIHNGKYEKTANIFGAEIKIAECEIKNDSIFFNKGTFTQMSFSCVQSAEKVTYRTMNGIVELPFLPNGDLRMTDQIVLTKVE